MTSVEKKYTQSVQSIDVFEKFKYLRPSFGWYSQKQEEISNSRMYYSPLKGHAVYVSQITDGPTISSLFDDIVPIGVVSCLIPSHEDGKGKYPTYYQTQNAIDDFKQHEDAKYAWYSYDRERRTKGIWYYCPAHKRAIIVTHVTDKPYLECGFFDVRPLGIVTKFMGKV
jgi:hypothetical protein